MPEFDPLGTRIRDGLAGFGATTTADFNPQFAWAIPNGLTATEIMREQNRLLRPRRTHGVRPRQVPSLPTEERVIEFVIEKTDRYYTISAVVVNDKNKIIDQWTASTEEEADEVVCQMAEQFLNADRYSDIPPLNLRLNHRTLPRGHFTRDERMRYRVDSRDEVSEDQFALDIDEDAIVAEDVSKRERKVERFTRQMDRDTITVPF